MNLCCVACLPTYKRNWWLFEWIVATNIFTHFPEFFLFLIAVEEEDFRMDILEATKIGKQFIIQFWYIFDKYNDD